MAVFTKYIANFLTNFSVLPDYWQCCTIGILIASTLCVSLLLLVFNVIPNFLRGFKKENKLGKRSSRPKGVLERRSSAFILHPVKKDVKLSSSWRKSAVKFWPSPGSVYDCVVPCINCAVKPSDKLCRFVLCKLCCEASTATVCTFHTKNVTVKKSMSSNWFSNKPTKIDLSYSSLERCPERVGFIGSQLHTLNLSNNNLNDLPDEIGCLLGLQHLDLHNNSIKQLPDIIGNFVYLKELDLSSNNLTSLPKNIGSLKRLQLLRLCRNQLKQLPAGIGSIQQLQKLYVSKNRIEILPDELGKLSNIEVMQLRKNHLEDISNIMGELVRLESLDVSSNNLSQLPNSVVKCAALTRLRLQNNRIRLLPNQIGHLHQLRDLKVDSNRLRYLPTSLYSLQLYVFSVEDNPLLKRNSLLCMKFNNVQRKLVFPSLVELCARKITLDQTNWQQYEMPSTLKDLLANVNYCRSCEKPMFENCSNQLVFRKISGIENVPLCQHVCGLYHSKTCSFIQIADD